MRGVEVGGITFIVVEAEKVMPYWLPYSILGYPAASYCQIQLLLYMYILL
jgi:hypothetical protein